MASQIHLPFNLNGFIFIENLGQGTFATVYKAFKQVRLPPRSLPQRHLIFVGCKQPRNGRNKVYIKKKT